MISTAVSRMTSLRLMGSARSRTKRHHRIGPVSSGSIAPRISHVSGNGATVVPKVSIVTPTFNRADLLPETIRSILGQSFTDFEYLIIDDGSTDDTAAIVRGFGDRISYYWHDNVGEAASTNRGWQLARGRYFAFIASDDPVLPGWLERMVAFLDDHPDVIVAYPDWQIIDAESRKVLDLTTFEYDYADMVAWLNTIPGPGTLIRKSVLTDLPLLRDPSYRYIPDLECFLRLGLRGPFARVPEQLATWRRHPTSTTVADRSLVRAREMLRLADRFFARPDLPAEIRPLERYARSRAYWLASWIVETSHPLRSMLYLRKSYAISPADPPRLPAGLLRYPRPGRRAVLRAGAGLAFRKLPGSARLVALVRRGRGARVGPRTARLLARLLRLPARGLFVALAAVHVALLGCLLLLVLYGTRGFFDPGYYREASRPGSLSRRFPRLSFSFRGAWTLRDPNGWFSQRAYIQQRSGMTIFPPVLHYLLRDRYRVEVERSAGPPAIEDGVAPEEPSPPPPAAEEEALPPAPYDRFAALWPSFRSELLALQDVANQLSPTEVVRERLSRFRIGAQPSPNSRILRAVLERLPARVDHLLVVPWLGVSGGAEKVGHRFIRLLREHYRDGGLCIFAPDRIFDLSPEHRAHYGVPIIAINDLGKELGDLARLEILDRVLIELRPRTVHSNNSLAAWMAFLDHGRHYARDCNLFGSIYSNIRILDGVPVGFYWQFLPDVIDTMAGVITDNRSVIRHAEADFGFLPEQVARHHVVPTPVLGLHGPAEADLRGHRDPGARHSLWMSRISIEKRLDVLQAIAARCPDRRLSIYGATIDGGLPADLGWAESAPNVTVHGEFGSLADLPLEQFDSYVFTTSAEGMPIALLEAVMLGLPVVAPDVGGIGELIDGDTGWLVSGPDSVDEYVAALEEIRRSPAEAARRVAAAQRRLLERHSWASFRHCVEGIPGYLHRRQD